MIRVRVRVLVRVSVRIRVKVCILKLYNLIKVTVDIRCISLVNLLTRSDACAARRGRDFVPQGYSDVVRILHMGQLPMTN